MATVTATLDRPGTQTITADDSTATIAGTSNAMTVTLAAGSEFQVNTYTPGNQQIAKVAMDAAGDYVVVWQSYYYNTGYAHSTNLCPALTTPRRGTGEPVPGNTYTGREATTPTVAMDAAGDFVVAWVGCDTDVSAYEVYAQQYNSSGASQGSNFLVNTYTAGGSQLAPAVAMDSAGDFVVAWNMKMRTAANTASTLNCTTPAAPTKGSEFQVNTYTPGNQVSPR